MKRNNLLATVVLFSGPCCFAQVPSSTTNGGHHPSNPVFSLTVASPSGTISLKGHINIVITVVNISDKEILWESERGKDSVYKAFKFSLKKDDRDVETTFFHRKISGRHRPGDPVELDSGSSVSLPHAPGKMFEMTIDLKRLYEIKDPGAYTVEVSRMDEYSRTMVRSQPIIMKIVP